MTVINGILSRHRNAKIQIIGHSLGGGLAVIAAWHLSQILFNVGVITFGQPRVGNARFHTMLFKNVTSHLRVVNNNDIVPRIPPWPAGYSHGGLEIYINPNEEIILNPTWWEIMAESAVGFYKAIGEPGLDVVRDHQIGSYVKALT